MDPILQLMFRGLSFFKGPKPKAPPKKTIMRWSV